MRRGRLAVAMLVVAVVLSVTVPGFVFGTASGDDIASDEPRLSVHADPGTLDPGGVNEVVVRMTNSDEGESGNNPAAATSVRATLRESDTPFTVLSGTQVVDTVPVDGVGRFAFRVRVPANVSSGTYTLPLDVRYVWDDINENEGRTYVSDEADQRRFHLDLRIEDRARFAVVDTGGGVAVGDTDTTNVTVRNVGTRTARDATIGLESPNGDVTLGRSADSSRSGGGDAVSRDGQSRDGSGQSFGGGGDSTTSANRYLGRLAPGEEATASYRVSVDDSAAPQEYSLFSSIEYEDEDGTDRTSRRIPFGFRPLPEQRFEIRNVTSDLAVGDEGTVSGMVVNTGTTTADAAVVEPVFESADITALTTQYAVGTLAPGERADIRFDVEVSDSAEAAPRQLSYEVRYRNRDGDLRRSESVDVSVPVGNRSKEFRVRPVNATFAPGTSGRYELRVTNMANQTLAGISSKLFTDDPLSSSDDESFIPRLRPGESSVAVFQLSVDGSAMAKTYSTSVDFRYEDAEGDVRISDAYAMPVLVRDRPQGGSFPFAIPVVGFVLAAVSVGGYLRFGRDGGTSSLPSGDDAGDRPDR